MLWQAPGGIRLEHVVLEHKLPGISPVIRNFTCVMVSHHVRLLLVQTTGRIEIAFARLRATLNLLLNEAIHFAAIDISGCIRLSMRTTEVLIIRIMIGLHTLVRLGIRHADPCRNPICARICTKVCIKGTILLHDHNNVLNLVDVITTSCSGSTTSSQRCCSKEESKHWCNKILYAFRSHGLEQFHMLTLLISQMYSLYHLIDRRRY